MTTEEYTASFGYWVRRQRRALDLTQAMLARKVGCATVTIFKIERDERLPSLQMAKLLAEHLGITDEQCQLFLAVARGERSADRMAIGGQPQKTPLQTVRRSSRAMLPTVGASAIERAMEHTALLDLLGKPEVRLISLVGTGGVGKTHLSIQVAKQAAPRFKDGVCFIPLESVRQAEQVTATLAGALGVMESAGVTLLESVLSILESRRQLLVLDNFEQVLAAADVVAALLDACPHLKIIVTSREPLRLRLEHVYPLSPLQLPDSDDHALDVLTQSQAVQLFALRARTAMPAFSLDAESAPIIAAICIFLDGLPLAIELAVARLALFSLPALLDALTGGSFSTMQLLRSDLRDVDARQRSLYATVAWSYHLLTDEEQKLFRRLAVFAGGFTREAAQAVGMYDDMSDESVAAMEMLALLASLVRKSLVITDSQPDGSTRYRLFETMREYGLERLAERDEEETVRAAHAAWFVDLVTAAEPELVGLDQVQWLDRLDTEVDNLHSAIGWSIVSGEAEIALAFGANLYQFWRRRNRLAEGRYWLNQILALPTDTAFTVLRAKAYVNAGLAAMNQGSYAEAERAYQNSIALAQDSNHHATLGRAYTYLGWIYTRQRNYDGAQRLIGRAIQLCQEVTYNWGLGMAFNNQSVIDEHRDQPQAALSSARQSLRYFQKSGDHWGIAFASARVASALGMQTQFEEACVYAEQSLKHSRAIQDRMAIALALTTLGRLALQQEQPDDAQHLVRNSLQIRRTFNDRHGLASNIGQLAAIELYCLRPSRAATLARVAQREFQRMDVAAPMAAVDLDEILDAARNHLDEEAFASACAKAEVCTLADVVEELLAQT